MLRVAGLSLVVAVAGASAALARPGPPGFHDARYVFGVVEQGYLRMDRRTGLVSLCRGRGRAWSCALVGDDRDRIEGRMAQMQSEIAALKRLLQERSTPPQTAVQPGAASLTPPPPAAASAAPPTAAPMQASRDAPDPVSAPPERKDSPPTGPSAARSEETPAAVPTRSADEPVAAIPQAPPRPRDAVPPAPSVGAEVSAAPAPPPPAVAPSPPSPAAAQPARRTALGTAWHTLVALMAGWQGKPPAFRQSRT